MSYVVHAQIDICLFLMNNFMNQYESVMIVLENIIIHNFTSADNHWFNFKSSITRTQLINCKNTNSDPLSSVA